MTPADTVKICSKGAYWDNEDHLIDEDIEAADAEMLTFAA